MNEKENSEQDHAPDDAWVLKMNQTINKSTLEQAADAVAAALAEGIDPEGSRFPDKDGIANVG